MRCKVHPLDHTSSVGVCASCLRHRLFPVLAAQAQADARAQTRHLRDGHKFFSTPQPKISIGGSAVDDHKLKKKKNKFSVLLKLFGLRTGKRVTGLGSDDRAPEPEEITTTVSSSPLWFSSVLVTRKQTKTSSDDHLAIKSHVKNSNRTADCGFSPSMYSGDEEDLKHYYVEELKRRTKTSGTTRKREGRRSNLSQNVLGIGFWSSPNRHWSQGGVRTDVVVHL